MSRPPDTELQFCYYFCPQLYRRRERLEDQSDSSRNMWILPESMFSGSSSFMYCCSSIFQWPVIVVSLRLGSGRGFMCCFPPSDPHGGSNFRHDSTIFSPRGILQQFLITSLVDTPLLVLKPNLALWLCIKEPAMLANCRLIFSLTVPRNRVLHHGCARCFLWLCLGELVTSNLLALSQTHFNYSRSHD